MNDQEENPESSAGSSIVSKGPLGLSLTIPWCRKLADRRAHFHFSL